MYFGWHQVAFTRDALAPLTPTAIGALPLVLVRRTEALGAFDAVCPHRGANLAHGGELDGDVIVCPFHGRRIALGRSRRRYCVRGYTTVELGGCVFVLLRERYANGFTEFLASLVETHVFVPGFTLTVRVPSEYVIENVFDADHFKAVHGLKRTPRLQLRRGDHGELTVESVFETRRPNPWQEDVDTLGESVESRFCARVFSPTLVATELGPRDRSHVVFTAATPTPDGASVIRLSLAVRSDDGAGPSDETIMSLLQGSRRAFDQDIGVWEHLVTDAPPRYAPSDRPVIEYRAFCEEFRDRDH
ncbi:MAG: Rieske 2Fe-2S domain-containing protein [Actinobacteria bacterium]|nr:MAG: Rieske 2Fe-2S domain-containing protein [Actinomycetota bacterium]